MPTNWIREVRKYSNTGKQEKIIFQPLNKVKTFSSSSRAQVVFWSQILWAVLKLLKSPRGGRRSISIQTWVGTRRLMMLTPSYLITNQSKECPWTDHTLCNLASLTVFWNLSLKYFREFKSCQHYLPLLLAWCPTVNAVLFFTITWCHYIGFTGWAGKLIFVICRFFDDTILIGMSWYMIVILICISLITDLGHLFTGLSTTCMFMNTFPEILEHLYDSYFEFFAR